MFNYININIIKIYYLLFIIKFKFLIYFKIVKKSGVSVPKRVIAEKILENEAVEWTKTYEQKRNQVGSESVNKRTAIFKKNEQITG